MINVDYQPIDQYASAKIEVMEKSKKNDNRIRTIMVINDKCS